MDLNKLADALIPDDDLQPHAYYEEKYPPRAMKKGAEVTRLAPSPTGFMHLGNLYVALANERIAHGSGGVLYLRIEDTDSKRKVEGAVDVIQSSLRYFGIDFDEGAEIGGEYGPYYQQQRAKIYRAYAKELIRRGRAYPCFCTEEELAAVREKQTENKLLPGYYGEFAKCRDLSEAEIYRNLAANKPYVIRFRSEGDVEKKSVFHDEIKGDITVTENNQDVVILKSDGIPTYHFAHVIDDHLMRTTLVIRGEEWLASLSIHIELFKALGFRMPRYGHNCSIQKIDETDGTRRKLSKRKDPEASLVFYREEGYHPLAVRIYLMTLLNSNFEEWHLKFPDKPVEEFRFSIAKMGKSGALFDLDKLNDVSKDVLARLSAGEMADFLQTWAEGYGTAEQQSWLADRDYLLQVLALCMGVGAKKRRKDFVTAKQAADVISYFFRAEENPAFRADGETVKAVLQNFMAVYDPADDNAAWFDKLKKVADALGFASDMKAYKAAPENYRGNVSDVAEIVRVALTGRANTPDLCTIMRILGAEECRRRVAGVVANV